MLGVPPTPLNGLSPAIQMKKGRKPQKTDKMGQIVNSPLNTVTAAPPTLMV
jgi:hypothetical protein